MNRTNPPRIATWMMEHLAPADSDEAIAGDLLEHFRAGRSSVWYWRQAITAIAVEWGRSAWRRRAPLLFAAMWSLLSPAWELFFANYSRHRPLIGAIWRLPFPLSTITDLALRVAVDMSFIWAGVVVYVALCRVAFGKMHLRRPWMALLGSVIAFAIASLGVVAIVGAMFAMGYFHGRGVGGETFTLPGIVEDFGIWTLFVRFQYFAGTAVSLWFLTPKTEPTARQAA
jgi:hypothetical protein